MLLAEYRALVNTNLHFKLFTVPLTNTDTALGLGIHSLYQTHYPLIHTKFPQCPPNDRPGHSAKCLLQVYESHVKSLVGSWILFLQLPNDKDCICCASTWDKAKLGIMDWHHLSDKAVHNPLQDFYDLFCQLETTVVTPFQFIPLTLVETDNETLLPVGGYLANYRWLQLPGHGSQRCLCHPLL